MRGILASEMPRAPRPARSYHHRDLPTALVAASLAILDEEGITGLTLRSAARRVGVSHAAPKNHFGDLRGLLAAVAAEGFRRLTTAMQSAADAHDDPRARLVEIGCAYVRFASGSPGHFRAMFHPELGAPTPGSALAEASAAALAVLVTAMTAAQHGGSVREGDPVEDSLAAWSLVHGLSALLVDHHLENKGLPHDADALARRFGEALLHGLAGTPREATVASSSATASTKKRTSASRRRR